MTGLRCLLWPSLVECMEWMSLCWRLTSSAYVCLYHFSCTWIWGVCLKVLIIGVRRSIIRSHVICYYFAVQINNTLQWRWRVCVAWLTFVDWMYGTDAVVLALDEQGVRLPVLLSLCVLWIWSVCLKVLIIDVRYSTRSYVISISCAILLFK